VLTVPVAALQGTPATACAGVVLRRRQGRTREVRTGLSDRLRVQVLDGLHEGDHLLIGPPTSGG
jgi:macrolide-specific efflux system membrane fusion protein